MYASISGDRLRRGVGELFFNLSSASRIVNPFCDSLNKERRISFLGPCPCAPFAIRSRASAAAESAIFPREKTIARSVSRPFRNCSSRRGTSAGETSSSFNPDWLSCSMPRRISSSWDFFFAKENFLGQKNRYALVRSDPYPAVRRTRSSATPPPAHRDNFLGTTWRLLRPGQTRLCCGSWHSADELTEQVSAERPAADEGMIAPNHEFRSVSPSSQRHQSSPSTSAAGRAAFCRPADNSNNH